MVQNHWPAYKTQVAFEDLYWIQAWLMINSTEAYYSKTYAQKSGALPLHRLQRHCDGWPTSRPLAARRRRRALPLTWPFTWPLMRNWDHGVSRMTKVGYGNLTVNEGRQWEESGRFRENCVHIVVWPTNQWWQVGQSLSLYRVGLIKRISGQTGMSLYGLVGRGCRRTIVDTYYSSIYQTVLIWTTVFAADITTRW